MRRPEWRWKKHKFNITYIFFIQYYILSLFVYMWIFIRSISPDFSSLCFLYMVYLSTFTETVPMSICDKKLAWYILHFLLFHAPHTLCLLSLAPMKNILKRWKKNCIKNDGCSESVRRRRRVRMIKKIHGKLVKKHIYVHTMMYKNIYI